MLLQLATFVTQLCSATLDCRNEKTLQRGNTPGLEKTFLRSVLYPDGLLVLSLNGVMLLDLELNIVSVGLGVVSPTLLGVKVL